MNGAVADLMQAHRAQMRPTLEARRQVMTAGFRIGCNGTLAERTDIGQATGDGAFDGRYGRLDPPRPWSHHIPANASRSFLLSRSLSLLS